VHNAGGGTSLQSTSSDRRTGQDIEGGHLSGYVLDLHKAGFFFLPFVLPIHSSGAAAEHTARAMVNPLRRWRALCLAEIRIRYLVDTNTGVTKQRELERRRQLDTLGIPMIQHHIFYCWGKPG